MTHIQLEREKNYQVSMSIMKSMHSKGIISSSDLKKIDELLTAKYQPIIGSLVGQN